MSGPIKKIKVALHFNIIRQPCSIAGTNAHNQIGPQVTAACVKLCRVDNSLTTHGDCECTLKTVMLACGPWVWIKRIPGAGELVWSQGKQNSKILFL